MSHGDGDGGGNGDGNGDGAGPGLTAGPSARRAALAVGALFFVNGATFSNWLPRIPEVRDRLGVDNAGLGAALIGGGLGGLIASLFVSRLLSRFGSRRCVTVAAAGLALCLPAIAVVPSAFALAAVLTGLGTLDVVNDLSMNAQGVVVQERLRRSIMQRLHGAWSLGFLSGAAVGSLAGAARLDIRVHLVAVSVVLLGTVAAARPSLVRHDEGALEVGAASAGRRSGRRRLPPAGVLAMAAMAGGVAFVEGMPNDWSAVALHDVFGLDRFIGAGALLYAASMLGGRLVGDHALERLGAGRLLDVALVVAALGVVLVAVAPAAGVALAGFVVWGLGVSVLFPQLYTLGATLPGSSAGAGLAAMAIGQRIGFLAEPVLVGVLAEASALRPAIAAVGAVGFVLVLAARRFVAQHDAIARRAVATPHPR
ncbi:MAG: MFS transporter [Acidimicrobiia bacterium]